MAKPITSLQFQKLQELLYSGDRTGYYIKYYELTGSIITLQMAKISSFSGLIGGIARETNSLLESYPDYPKGGVIWLSKEIALAHFKEVRSSFDMGRGGILNDEFILLTAQKVWGRENIQQYFPGNLLICYTNLQSILIHQLNHELGYSLNDRLKWAWGNFSAPGAWVTIKGFTNHIWKEGLNSEAKFYKSLLDNKNLEHKITEDHTVAYIIDKSSSKVVFVTEVQNIEGVLNALTNTDFVELFY